MVNFIRFACALAIAGVASTASTATAGASSQASASGLAKASRSVTSIPSGVAAPSGAKPSGITGPVTSVASDALPSLSLLNSKRQIQSLHNAAKSRVGEPVGGGPLKPTSTPNSKRQIQGLKNAAESRVGEPMGGGPLKPTGTPTSARSSSAAISVSTRATGIQRRQASASSSVHLIAHPLTTSAAAAPVASDDVSAQKFSKLPSGFGKKASSTVRSK